MKIDLKYPIPVKGEGGTLVEVSTLTMGRLKAKHFKTLPSSIFDGEGKNVTPGEMIPMIAVLTGVPEESIDELDAADLLEIGAKLADFLSESLQTGKS